MYSRSAPYYDAIYSFKDYRAEAERIIAIAREKLRSPGKRLLDVACGTGRHVEHLQDTFQVEGLDNCRELLAIARRRNPGIPFHQADMSGFDIGHPFDVVICLFGAIGYATTLEALGRTVACMTRHLVPGGVLVVEPWLTPDAWRPGTVHANFVDEPDLKIARISASTADGRLSRVDMQYLIGVPGNIDHFVERHQLGLFATDEMRSALAAGGLEVEHDPEGFTGRGLFVGTLPPESRAG